MAKSRRLVFLALLLTLTSIDFVKGLVEISPSGVASVCQEGDQLELMCTVSGMFQRWDFTVILGNGAVMNFMHSNTADGPSGVPPPVTVNSTMFTYSRLSARDRLPLITRLIISSVSEGLNGVEVSCMDLEASESTTTTIRIIGVGDTQTSNLNIQTHSEQFLSDRVTVILKWTLSNPPSYYQQLLWNVSIVPDLEVPITYVRNMSVQLTLQYNTQYNVSVTQPGICRQPNQTAYMYIKLNYIKCSNPMVLTRTNVRVVGYEDPELEGENITFTCTSGLIGTGPISATCMGNGEWEPDPREVNCTAICGRPLYVLQIGDTITIMNYREFKDRDFDTNRSCCSGILITGANTTTCLADGRWELDTTQMKSEGPEFELDTANSTLKIALITAACVLVMTSVLIFIVGFISGHCFSQRQRKSANSTTNSDVPIPNPHVEDLELKTNVAYITLRPR